MPLAWNAALMLAAGAGGATIAWWLARRSGPSSRTEAVLRRLLDHSIDAAYRRDLRTDSYDYLSPALERVMGIRPDELRYTVGRELATDLVEDQVLRWEHLR